MNYELQVINLRHHFIMIVLRRIFLYLLPAILLFYGGDKMDNLFGYGLPSHNVGYEITAYLIGLVIINVIVPFSAEKTKKKLTEQDALIGLLLKNLRVNLNEELQHKFGVTNLNLNIRIFYPKNSFSLWCGKIFLGKRTFFLNDNTNLCVEPVGRLSFRVNPAPEGVIGRVFADKCMIYDCTLNDEKSKKEYQLNPHQSNATAGTRFVIAAPIFKDGSTDKIKAIVSFDSKKSVTLPNNNEWEHAIRDSCKIIHKCIPFICKNN